MKPKHKKAISGSHHPNRQNHQPQQCSTKSQQQPNNVYDENDGELEDAEICRSLFQSVRERKEQLVERLRIYNNLFTFHKTIKEDQVYLYKKLQDMDELYLRNTAAILRLGFCPCLVHQQTSPVGELLMKLHRKLRVWDKKVDEICDILKAPSTRKTTAAVMQILKVCESVKFLQDNADFDDIALPEIVWDLDNPFLEQLDISKLIEDWRNVRKEVRETLVEVEMQFQEICLEFGITRGPEQSVSSVCGSHTFAYDNPSMNLENEEADSKQPVSTHADDAVRDEEADGRSVDTTSSKVSSSFL